MKLLGKRRRLLPAIWLITVIALGGYSYWKFYLRPRPDIILITVDTLRHDHLGYAGYERKTSPNMDRLGKQGVVFLQATSFSDWTLPSHENLLTGNYPISNTTKCIPSSAKLLSEILKEKLPHQYTTGAFVSGVWLKTKFGLNQGFDTFDDDFPGGGRNIESYYDAILHWLDSAAGKPFFLWLHLMEPHFPYALHEGYGYEPSQPTDFDKYNTYFGSEEEMRTLYENRMNLKEKDIERAKALYDSEVSYTDNCIGLLMDELKKRGLFDQSMIIVTSDHGEGFGEHGRYFSHGYGVTDELTKVPLIIKMPGNSPKGKIIENQVQLSDVFATVLQVAGIPYEGSLLSKSLLPLIYGTESPHRKYAYSYSLRKPSYSVRDEKFKMIYSDKDGTYSLYDIRNDPKETTDIQKLKPDVFQKMKKEMGAFENGFSLSLSEYTGEKAIEIDEETREKLRALGYIQ